MAAPLLGPLLGAGVSALGSIFSSGSSNRANRKLWREQTRYNHPVEQMKRLQEAGLNPALIYGSGAQTATGQASSAPKMERPEVNPLADFQDMRRFKVQTDLTGSQVGLNEQRATLEGIKGNTEILKQSGMKLDQATKSDLHASTLRFRQLANENLEQEIIGNKIDNLVNDATAAARIKDVFYRNAERLNNMNLATSRGEQSTKESNARIEYMKSGQLLRDLEKQLKDAGLENSPYYARMLYKWLNITPPNAKENRDKALGTGRYRKNPIHTMPNYKK